MALVLALQEGLLDDLKADQIGAFRSELPGWLQRTAAPIVQSIAQSGHLEDAAAAELKKTLAALAAHVAPPAAPATGAT